MPGEEDHGGVTSEEIEAALNRKHDVDNETLIKGIKKILASNKKGGKNMYRLLECQYKQLLDSWMLKFNVEKFIDGKNAGSRWFKGYFSEKVKEDIFKLIRDIPEKTMRDTRTNTDFTIPNLHEKENKRALTEFDLEKLFE